MLWVGIGWVGGEIEEDVWVEGGDRNKVEEEEEEEEETYPK